MEKIKLFEFRIFKVIFHCGRMLTLRFTPMHRATQMWMYKFAISLDDADWFLSSIFLPYLYNNNQYVSTPYCIVAILLAAALEINQHWWLRNEHMVQYIACSIPEYFDFLKNICNVFAKIASDFSQRPLVVQHSLHSTSDNLHDYRSRDFTR